MVKAKRGTDHFFQSYLDVFSSIIPKVWKVLVINKHQDQKPASCLTCKLQFGLFNVFAHLTDSDQKFTGLATAFFGKMWHLEWAKLIV